MNGNLVTLISMLRGPGSSTSHKGRIERLFGPMAADYDSFRRRYLHGRRELMEHFEIPQGGRLVELGGGTGRNLEFLGERLKLLSSARVVDICTPLLEVARERHRRLGWDNVELVEGDATCWQPPEGEQVDVAFFSYSLTMMPDWYLALENALAMLKPGGQLGVVDFYFSRKRPSNGDRHHAFFHRYFWRLWFSHVDVFLSHDHLPYLQQHTERVYLHEGMGSVPYVPLLKAPYFAFIGRKRG